MTTEEHLTLTIVALVTSVGGVMRVTHADILNAISYKLTTSEDPDTGELVLRTTREAGN